MGIARIVLASALSAWLGCNAVLGIEEKQLGDASADPGSFVLSFATAQAVVRLVPGQSATVGLVLQRSGGFTGPVRALVSGLPRGVSADAPTFAPTDATGTLTLRATSSADLGAAVLSIAAASATASLDALMLNLVVQGTPGSVDLTFAGSGRVVPFPDGMIDQGIGPGGVKLQTDGSVVLCGHARTATADSSVLLARMNPAGALDPTFGRSGTGIVMANSDGSLADGCISMVLRPSGGLVFAGWSTPDRTMPATMMAARFSSTGNPSGDFGLHGFATATPDAVGSRSNGLLPSDNDRIIVGGSRSASPSLFRLLKNGTVDNTFGPTGGVASAVPGGIVRWLATQSTGSLIAAVESSTFRVVRATADGALDPSFGTAGIAAIDAGGHGSSTAVVALVKNDDTIAVIGTATGDSGSKDIAVALLTSSGQLMIPDGGPSGVSLVHFGTGDSVVSSAVLESDGSIVIAGQTPTDAGPAFSVVRLLPNGSRDTSFGPAGRQTFDVNGMAQGIDIDDLGRVVVAGFSGAATDGGVVVYRLWP
jgi:uncharacterized delta-60 repeat protein